MKDFEKTQAETLISEYNLIINNQEYSFEAISVHSPSDCFYEHDRPQPNCTWHISNKEIENRKFVPYIDIHYVDKSHLSYRLRINALRRISDSVTICGPEKVWSLADLEIGTVEFNKYDYKDINQVSTPKMYLIRKPLPESLSKTFWVPRLLSDPKNLMRLEEIIARLKPVMITTNFEWMKNFDYIQKKVISIYFLDKYLKKNPNMVYPEEHLVSFKKIIKHLKLYQSAKSKDKSAIYNEYCNSSKKKHLKTIIETMSAIRDEKI
jgi:hypothetical protein